MKNYEIWSLGKGSPYSLYVEGKDTKLLEKHNFRPYATYHDIKGNIFACQFIIPRDKKETVLDLLGEKPSVKRHAQSEEIEESRQGTLF